MAHFRGSCVPCGRRAVGLVPRPAVLVCVGLRALADRGSQTGSRGGGWRRQAAQRGALVARTSGLHS